MGLYIFFVLGIHRFGKIIKIHRCTRHPPHQTCSEVRWSTPQNLFWIDKRIFSLFKNILYFSPALTRNLVFFEGFVHCSRLFHMNIQLVLRYLHQNMEEPFPILVVMNLISFCLFFCLYFIQLVNLYCYQCELMWGCGPIRLNSVPKSYLGRWSKNDRFITNGDHEDDIGSKDDSST